MKTRFLREASQFPDRPTSIAIVDVGAVFAAAKARIEDHEKRVAIKRESMRRAKVS